MPEQLLRSGEKGNAIPVVACHGGFRLRRAGAFGHPKAASAFLQAVDLSTFALGLLGEIRLGVSQVIMIRGYPGTNRSGSDGSPLYPLFDTMS